MSDDESEVLSHREQRLRDRIPREGTQAGDVLAERRIDTARARVVSTDGELSGQFADGRRWLSKGHAAFDHAVFPFEVHTDRRGDVTVRLNTKFYWEDEEIHVKARHAYINADGRIRVDLF